jgi:hypothetical protein
MDLSNASSPDDLTFVRVDCESCGRPIGEYLFSYHPSTFVDSDDDLNPWDFDFYEADRKWPAYPLSGRHRGRWVEGRGHAKAMEIECGCSHRRKISRGGLKKKLERAPEPRDYGRYRETTIWL